MAPENHEETVYLFRNLNAPELPPPDEELEEALIEAGQMMRDPHLELNIPPEMLRGPIEQPREAEPTPERRQDLKFIEGVKQELTAALGLPKDAISSLTKHSLFSKTDFARRLVVEFSYQLSPGDQIPRGLMVYMAQLIEKALNENPATASGEAEIWIQQEYREQFPQETIDPSGSILSG